MSDGLVAGAIAGTLSGAPSTAWSVVRGESPFAATAAAGTLAIDDRSPRSRLIEAGVLAHLVISLGWGVVLATLLPKNHTVLSGTAAGLAIAGLDLGIIGARFPSIRSLPQTPQVIDHICYGATVAVIVSQLRRSRSTKY